jgi:molybdate transport system substrate-binding protein
VGRFSPLWVVAVAFSLAALLTSCGDDDGQTAASPSPGAVQGEIVVFAASSLTDAFKEAAGKFQIQNPNARITFSFASSSALAAQINEGAPADVFASADTAQMKVVTDKGNASDPAVFATNLPTVIVPKSGSSVSSLADLAKPGVRLVLAGPDVPIGKYSREILTNASQAATGLSPDFSEKVLANLKSNEANVRAVLTKVQLGEADAGIVYKTDAAVAANEVKQIKIPDAYNVVAQYPIAVTKSAKNTPGARAWIAFLASPDGQAITAMYGFGKP